MTLSNSKLGWFAVRATLAISSISMSTLAVSQEINCDALKSLYEARKYQQVIAYEKVIPPNFDPEAKSCLKNIAGLSWLKMYEDSQVEHAGYALQLFGMAAKEEYLPAAFNLLKYEFLLTTASLDPLMTGLTSLVAAGMLDANRKVSVLSYELGNRIIDSCYKSSESVCRGRKLSESSVNDFLSNSDRLLSQVREETNSRTADERVTKARIAMVLSILMFAASAALTASNVNLNNLNLYNTRPPPPAPNPVTHPWLFPQPKPMTCWQGYCW